MYPCDTFMKIHLLTLKCISKGIYNGYHEGTDILHATISAISCYEKSLNFETFSYEMKLIKQEINLTISIT